MYFTTAVCITMHYYALVHVMIFVQGLLDDDGRFS